MSGSNSGNCQTIGGPAENSNFPLFVFSLYVSFKSGIAASGEPIPLEKGWFGECIKHLQLKWRSKVLLYICETQVFMSHFVGPTIVA